MGYIKNFYGSQGPEFIRGFLAAMETYAVQLNGERWIGSPEQELRGEQRKAVVELGDDPAEYDYEI